MTVKRKLFDHLPRTIQEDIDLKYTDFVNLLYNILKGKIELPSYSPASAVANGVMPVRRKKKTVC